MQRYLTVIVVLLTAALCAACSTSKAADRVAKCESVREKEGFESGAKNAKICRRMDRLGMLCPSGHEWCGGEADSALRIDRCVLRFEGGYFEGDPEDAESVCRRMDGERVRRKSGLCDNGWRRVPDKRTDCINN